jgi:hypothetical protein
LRLKVFRMNNFWNNVVRYPRFFISSVAGLIIVILTPFKNLFKIRKLRIFLVIFFLLFIAILYSVIINMTAL